MGISVTCKKKAVSVPLALCTALVWAPCSYLHFCTCVCVCVCVCIQPMVVATKSPITSVPKLPELQSFHPGGTGCSQRPVELHLLNNHTLNSKRQELIHCDIKPNIRRTGMTLPQVRAGFLSAETFMSIKMWMCRLFEAWIKSFPHFQSTWWKSLEKSSFSTSPLYCGACAGGCPTQIHGITPHTPGCPGFLLPDCCSPCNLNLTRNPPLVGII